MWGRPLACHCLGRPEACPTSSDAMILLTSLETLHENLVPPRRLDDGLAGADLPGRGPGPGAGPRWSTDGTASRLRPPAALADPRHAAACADGAEARPRSAQEDQRGV